MNSQASTKWVPITNAGRVYLQSECGYAVLEDSRGRYITYKSLETAKKAADKLNRSGGYLTIEVRA